MEVAIITFGIGALIFLAYFFTHLFKRFQIPDVLFLVVIGLILGPITGLVDVAEFGILGELFATLTLLIILFDSGLRIQVKELFSSAPRALLLMLLTFVVTIAVVAPIGHLVLGIPVPEALLVGVLVGGVSSGIGIPLLKNIPLSKQAKSLLTFETNINDVLTIGVVFAFIDFTQQGIFNIREFASSLGEGLLVALVIGVAAALLWSRIIRHVRGIQNNVFMTPALVLIVFGISEMIGASGVFAAFAFGITLGNLQSFDFRRISPAFTFDSFRLTKWEKRTFSALVFLLKTYFFVYIGLSISIDDLLVLAIAAGTALALYGVRILTVEASVGSRISVFDRQVLHRLIPKGLVGAALITLIEHDVTKDFTYGIILFSIVLTSILIFLLPKEKQMTEKDS